MHSQSALSKYEAEQQGPYQINDGPYGFRERAYVPPLKMVAILAFVLMHSQVKGAVPELITAHLESIDVMHPT